MEQNNKLTHLIETFPKIFKGEYPRSRSDIPPGWESLIHALCKEIESALTEDELRLFTVLQIKEKLGSLRFYFQSNLPDDKNDIVRRLISQAEIESSLCCLECGAICLLDEISNPPHIGPYCSNCISIYMREKSQ